MSALTSKKTILVYVDIKYLTNSERKKYLEKKEKEFQMDYKTMFEGIQEGKKARRPLWDPDMYLWYSHEMLLHTHPYWPDQDKLTSYGGFPYVCEKDDGISNDWVFVSA